MRVFTICLVLIGLSSLVPSHASNACSPMAIETRASVSVSDGSHFETETRFHSAQAASFRQIRNDQDILIVVEGPFSWTRSGDETRVGSEFHKLFALGHQFHAFLIDFDTLASTPHEVESVSFLGQDRAARSGAYPYGGQVHLIHGEVPNRPAGLLFEFPETPAISVEFRDWRQVGTHELPFALTIDDGSRIFDYSYSGVSVSKRSPLWFMETIGSSALDSVDVYRLHRTLLAAHCLGDASLMAELSMETTLSANRGALSEIDRQALQDRFESVFETLDYQAYLDLKPPHIRVSESGDIAWVGVEVLAEGVAIESGAPFQSQWAWFMMAEKVGGEWRFAGTASNMAPVSIAE